MRRRRLIAPALLAVLVGLILAAHAALSPGSGVITLSGPVTVMGQTAPMGIDARTRRAFVVTGAAVPGLPPPRGTRGYLDVLDTTSGALVRSVALGPAPGGLVVDDRTNRVFVTDVQDSTVRVFDARTGALLRVLSIKPLAPNDIAVDTRTGRVFIASTLYNTVQTFDARSGALLRTVRNAGDTLAVDERTGRVFAYIANNGSGTNAVAVLDARSGALLRTVMVSQTPLQLTVDAATDYAFITGATDIFILDARSGQVVRTLPARSALRVVSAMGGRLLLADYYMGGVRQRLPLVDTRTGRTVRTVMLGTSTDLITADWRRGRVFVASPSAAGSGRVWMIDARSGGILHTSDIPASPTAVAVDERGARVFIATAGVTDRSGNSSGPGGVTMLDARDGRVLRTVALANDPTALLVDESTGHVFVFMGGSVSRAPDAWGWVPPFVRRWVPFLTPSAPSIQVSPSSVRMLGAMP